MANRIGKSKPLVVAVFITLIFASSSWAVSLAFEPVEITGRLGNTMNVDVMVAGLDQTNLAGFDLKIDFDETLLSFMDYALGDGLGGSLDAWDLSNGYLGSGKFHLSEMSLLWDFDYQADSFSIARLSFEAIKEGLSILSFSDVTLSDDWGAQLFADFVEGRVSVTSASPVPEPASMLLLGTGLLLAGGLSRIMKQQRK